LIPQITAAILAGGKNKRIATEKSLLQISNVVLIDKIVGLLENIFPELIIITGKESLKKRFPEHKTVDDYYKNCGPLAGIHAALKTASSDAVFVFACDMPNLNSGLIRNMSDYYINQKDTPKLLVPRHKEGYEPLHALYNLSLLPLIEKQLSQQNNKISSFYSLIGTEYYDVPDNYIPIFYNINTKEDLLKLSQTQQASYL